MTSSISSSIQSISPTSNDAARSIVELVDPTLVEDSTKLQNLNTLGAILLGIFTIVSFVGNIFLISTVASSYQLRQSIFNYFLVNIGVINLIDTSVNLVLSMLYVSTGQWQLGRAACVLNSFFQQFVLIETMLSTILLSIDRAVALQSIHRYEERLTRLRTLLIIGALCSVGAVVSLPILADAVWSEPHRYRYFCCNYARNPLGYPVSVVVICFVLPLAVAFVALGAVFWRAHEERLRRRAMLPERLADYTDFIVDNRRVQKHMELSKYAVIVFLIYFVLQGPYVVLNFWGQIQFSLEFIGGSSRIASSYMLIPGDGETAITWLKTLFPVCFPFVTFCLYKDIWRKFKDLICCRRTNVIAANVFSASLEAADVAALAAAGGHQQSGHHQGNGGQGQGVNGGNGNGSNCYYTHAMMGGKEMANVVTIVPTSAGIHQIRPGNDRCEYADVPQMAASMARRRRSRGQTSDYDSDSSSNDDSLSAGVAQIVIPPLDPSESSNSAQWRRANRNGRNQHQQPVSTVDDHPLADPPVDHTLDPSIPDSTLAISADLLVSINRSTPSINNNESEWPTVFRPKSSPRSEPPLPASTSAKHGRTGVNPGVVPSPERSTRRRSKSITHVEDDPSISAERPPVDPIDGLADLLGDSLVVRHNHLPPLHIEPNSLSPRRKASSDKPSTTDSKLITTFGDKASNITPVGHSPPNSGHDSPTGLTKIDDGWLVGDKQAVDKAGDNTSITSASTRVRRNSQVSIRSMGNNEAVINPRQLPNLPQ